MKTKENTTKSAKTSMLIFMLHFAKINFIVSVKKAFIPMLKTFALIALWVTPLVINCNTVYNIKFNAYYMFISVIIGLFSIVIIGIIGDINHAVFLNSKKYKLSTYDKIFLKLYSIL